MQKKGQKGEFCPHFLCVHFDETQEEENHIAPLTSNFLEKEEVAITLCIIFVQGKSQVSEN